MPGNKVISLSGSEARAAVTKLLKTFTDQAETLKSSTREGLEAEQVAEACNTFDHFLKAMEATGATVGLCITGTEKKITFIYMTLHMNGGKMYLDFNGDSVADWVTFSTVAGFNKNKVAITPRRRLQAAVLDCAKQYIPADPVP